ncbi:NAD(P)H-binding protein [Nitratireductor kimnyeongensis]|uniref:NAD(P)H-binding protein n=1 Tax=Nitratireductor kimnyeongensis TaxID=430679 RepID=A0ABW0TBI0_9HYPH|nr:NAD(P)H-binding protein [Nitratireductor kimnyeongensis]QZZ35489.1 NAD(P)H-binding protein [Nitratireductor kimnyeongensis]
MTIAVTAVSGQLGREIARNLIAMPEAGPVIGLARTPERSQDLGIEVRAGDYDKPDELAAALAGVDTVLLVSGMAAPDARIGQHRNVITAAKAAGVKKIVYTSIQGMEQGTAFSPVVQSNRQTEADIRASGLIWAIGRNGIYIEPDVDYIDIYRAKGEIANSAGDGKCGYTTRPELGFAYARLLTRPEFDGKVVDLHGTSITQIELAEHLNATFGTSLTYRRMTSEEYVADRTAELGPFFGPIIGGIYDGIRLGAFHKPGDFEAVAGRPHVTWNDYFWSLKA